MNTQDKINNILFLSRTSVLGGAQKTLLETMKRLEKEIFKPILAVPDADGLFYREALKNGLEVKVIKMPFIQVTKNPFKLFIFLIKIIRLNILFFSILKKMDIKMIVCNLFQESFYIGLASRLLHIKMIIYIKGIMDKKWKKIIRAKVCDLFSDKIIAVSKKAGADIISYLKNTGKVIVIHEGIDEDFIDFKFRKNEFLMNYPLLNFKDNEFIVLNVGNISELKGQHLLLESAASPQLADKNIKYIFLGEVWFEKDMEYKKHLYGFIKENNIEDKVLFLGYQENIRDFMMYSDLIVHCPTLDDCFPMAILESLSLGKLIAATDVGGIPEMIQDGLNGYLCTVDTQELADKILYVYNNRDGLNNVKKNAAKTVKDNFMLKKQMIKTKKVYYDLLDIEYKGLDCNIIN